MIDFFKDYNQLQMDAICSSANRICVFAGPGTGKTKTLVGRYIYLQKELGIKPANILCLTFTKKAAEEMEKRISLVCGDDKSKYIGTIHSIANRILSTDIFHLGFPNRYSILTEDEQRLLINELMKDLHLYDESNITFKEVFEFINKKKATDDSYIELLLNRELLEGKIAEIEENSFNKMDLAFLNYLRFQSKNYYLDYNDLIIVTIYLLQKNESILHKWSSKFQYILVDEFQDLTDKEFCFIELLSKSNGRIFGVGDPDQSIYGFRGSKVKIFNEFYKTADASFDFIDNYRSYQDIIDFSHDLISANEDRVADVSLKCIREVGSKVKLIHTADRYSEAIYVANKIQSLCKSGAKRNECAILYRNNQCSLVFEEYFQLKKIPYKVYSNNEFFNCDEIKTALSYIKFLIYRDDISFINIYRKPNRYVSNVMINKIKELAVTNKVSYWTIIKDNYLDTFFKGTLNDFVLLVNKFEQINPNDNFEEWAIRVLGEFGFLNYVFSIGDEDKVNRIKQLIDMIHVFEPTDPERNVAEEFLNFVALLNDGDVKEEEEKVQFMSIHCSKGTEFKYVFVIDFNEGFIPSSKAESKEDIMEERRVAYVAFTRAKDQLFVLESNGDDGKAQLSSFAQNISPENYELEQYIAADRKAIKTIYCGAHVKNKLFGNGVVLSINSANKTCVVKFEDSYKEREVPLNTLVLNNKYRELNFDIDERLVAKIKKENEQQYELGDIVIHKLYGTGIITRIIDKNSAFVQFKDLGSVFDLTLNSIVKRSEYIRFLEN